MQIGGWAWKAGDGRASGVHADGGSRRQVHILRGVSRAPRPPETRAPDSPLAHRALRLGGLAAATLKASGPRGLVWSALAAMGVRRLVVHRLDARVSQAAEAVDGIAVRQLSEADLPAYRTLRGEAVERDAIRHLATGAECVGAWRGERLVAVRWLASGRVAIPYLGMSVELDDGVAYAFDAFCAVDERRRGLGAVVTAGVCARAGAGGGDPPTIINAVLPENHEGQALARRRSAPFGLLGSARLGAWLIVYSRLPAGYVRSPRALPQITESGATAESASHGRPAA